MSTTTQTAAFLERLHCGGAYGYWWTVEGRQSFWWEVGAATPLPGGQRNVYVGVHPTSQIPTTNRRGEDADPRAIRAQIATLAAINCLFAEYDAKDFSGDKDQIAALITTLDPAPSVVVDSGGGYHCYWLLATPYILDTDDKRERARKLQAAWVVLMDADQQSKDLARVLRVPGTHNRKYTPARPVVFVSCDLDRCYDIAELAALAQPYMEQAPHVTSKRTSHAAQTAYGASALRGEAEKVRTALDGQKHGQLLRSAIALGGLVDAGAVTEEQIIEALEEAISGRAADFKNAQHTIRDGIVYGKARPRMIPESNARDTKPAPKAAREYVTTKVDWRSQGTTLRELQHRVFDPERWIVEGIFPEGACLLAAKYKSKKSWLALALGLAVSMGGKALGRLDVHPGRVLYLDLEGRQQRIQKRTRSILGVRQIDWPDNFHIFTKWPQGDEGMQELEYWFASYPDTTLVIIDVLASFRRPMDKHEEIYRYDRDTVDPLNELFERYHAGGLLIHHFNKGKHDDVMDNITGSTGLPSAVNTMWAVRRDVNDSQITILEMRGRDLENDDPLALRWDTYLNQHVIEGPANEVAISTERKAIMQLLADDEPRTPKEIAAELGKSVEPIKQLLRKLLNEGLIDKPVYGKYARIAKRDHSDHSDHFGTSDHSDHSTVDLSVKSDRSSPRVIPPDHSVLEQQDGLNGKSDRSDRHVEVGATDNPIFAPVPPSKRTILRLYLRGNADKDQERARELCREYGIDYEQARKEAHA